MTKQLSAHDERAMAWMYRQGYSTAQAAYVFRVSDRRARAILKRQGVTLRHQHGTWQTWNEARWLHEMRWPLPEGWEAPIKVNRRIKGGMYGSREVR